MKEYMDLQSAVTVLAYLFWGRDGYDETFAKVEHAFRETWRHCGRLKSVLVVNETEPCVERFAAENDNVEIIDIATSCEGLSLYWKADGAHVVARNDDC